MGLDMYLTKRNILFGEDKERFIEATNIIEECDKKSQEAWYIFIDEEARKRGYSSVVDVPCEQMNIIRDDANKYMENNEEVDVLVGKIGAAKREVELIYKSEDVGYWRKHADLNEYFTKLYHDRGFSDEFNCKNLILSKEDCEEVLELAKDIRNGVAEIETGCGFFWGETTDDDWDETIRIFSSVLESTNFKTHEIVYSCWY